ncbi:MAG: hypothetical protein JKY80_01790 [Mariprofundaceae bacterium]|nr:hypothetical protein [Mariprofundaceae bacterium]
MQIKDFKDIVSTFSDPGEELLFQKNHVLISVNGALIEASLTNKSGDIYVDEGSGEMPASKWIVTRLARLELLASRLRETIEKTEYFVSPSALLSATLDKDVNLGECNTDDALQTTLKEIDDISPLETKVLYVTSDAGEGKTSLINEMAQAQAKRFSASESDWLLVPIQLGGRHFLRFDDITIGALQNRYRFPFLYYKSFIALVKMGVIVPAFDGFEEMFVENSSGEALSAMGILVGALDSQGTIIVAARKAYFEFENIRSQEKLFDSIRTESVSFGKLELNRWNQEQFISYCTKRKVNNPEGLYSKIIKRLGPKHPILTRAVLVKRLVDVIQESDSIDDFLCSLHTSGADFFAVFVRGLIEREANEKWIDRSGESDVGTSVLSIDGHNELLTYVALAMWESKVNYLKGDYLEFVADDFCETTRADAYQSQQIRARIGGHAMLVPSSSATSAVEFDHDEFRLFYLGEGIARLLKPLNDRARAEILAVFRRGVLPAPAHDALLRALKRDSSIKIIEVINFLIGISGMESRTSYSHMNCSHIIINLLSSEELSEMSIKDISFEANALRDKKLHGIIFTNCFFAETSLDLTEIKDCKFENCRFAQMRMSNNTKLLNVNFDGSVVDSLELKNELKDELIESWNPSEIYGLLSKRGIIFDTARILDVSEPLSTTTPDIELQDLMKVVRYLMRSTHISDKVLLIKLGVRGKEFISQTIPQLMKHGIFEEIDDRSGGRRFRLGVPVERLNSTIAAANGSFTYILNMND